jgi:hypothetical protein
MTYNEQAVRTAREQNPAHHTADCLKKRVDAFVADTPDPGCTCDGDDRIRRLNEGTDR